MSPIIGMIPTEPYLGYWGQMGLYNVIGAPLPLLPALMLLGFLGILLAYLCQYWVLGEPAPRQQIAHY